MSENWKIPDMRLDGVWFVDQGKVNMDDLVHCRPGSIVRCRSLPAVQYVPQDLEQYDRIAGMISDAAQMLSKGGQLAPLKDISPKDILERYLAEESSEQIAASYGVTRAALSLFMLRNAEAEWKDAQLTKALIRKERAEALMDTADNALDLTRAREQLRSAQWELERVCRRIYGQDAPQASSAVQININLRRENATNAVQHDGLEVIEAKPEQ